MEQQVGPAYGRGGDARLKDYGQLEAAGTRERREEGGGLGRLCALRWLLLTYAVSVCVCASSSLPHLEERYR